MILETGSTQPSLRFMIGVMAKNSFRFPSKFTMKGEIKKINMENFMAFLIFKKKLIWLIPDFKDIAL